MADSRPVDAQPPLSTSIYYSRPSGMIFPSEVHRESFHTLQVRNVDVSKVSCCYTLNKLKIYNKVRKVLSTINLWELTYKLKHTPMYARMTIEFLATL